MYVISIMGFFLYNLETRSSYLEAHGSLPLIYSSTTLQNYLSYSALQLCCENLIKCFLLCLFFISCKIPINIPDPIF